MASDLHSDVACVQAALDTPTLKLLDRKSAVVAIPIFEQGYSETRSPSRSSGTTLGPKRCWTRCGRSAARPPEATASRCRCSGCVMLCSSDLTGHRRIEQERIPLDVALDAVLSARERAPLL